MTHLKQPLIYLPIAMSAAAFAVVAVQVVFVGTARETDEGAAAHVWQLLMAGQLPMIAILAVTTLPHAPKRATLVLVVQVLAAVAAALPVFLLQF